MSVLLSLLACGLTEPAPFAARPWATRSPGGYELRHGRFDQQTSASSTCADWFVADVAVGITQPAP
jgi:hypothetical protein